MSNTFNLSNLSNKISPSEMREVILDNLQIAMSELSEDSYLTAKHQIFIGLPGCGKTEVSRRTLQEFFDIPSLTEGIYTKEGKKIAFKELHCHTPFDSIMLPSIKNKGGKKTVSFILEEYWSMLTNTNIDLCVVLIQDPNKNLDNSIGGFVKGLTDSFIGVHKIPPTICIITRNPYSEEFNNCTDDKTLSGAASVFQVELSPESLKYICSPYPEAEKFFLLKDNLKYIYGVASEDDPSGAYPCPRNWTAALRMFASAINNCGRRDRVAKHMVAKIGTKQTLEFLRWWNTALSTENISNISSKDLAKKLSKMEITVKAAVMMAATEKPLEYIFEVLEGISSNDIKGAFGRELLNYPRLEKERENNRLNNPVLNKILDIIEKLNYPEE